MSRAASIAEYKASRVASAVAGSQWVFFRDGDDALRDPWAAREIEIVAVVKPGALFRCRCLQPPARAHVNRTRLVNYSELW